MLTSPSQILCTICGVHIYYYGVIMAAAIVCGTIVSDWLCTEYYILKKETIINMVPYIIIFGVLGARLYYCLMDYHFYMRFPTEILAIRHGGLSIHGAIIGGFIGLCIFAKRNKLSVKLLCDISSVGLALGQAIGRWGNFFNSEAYGKPTNLPWKLFILPQYRQIPYLDNAYFHPAFLYESIFDLIIFGILIYFLRTKKYKKDGNLALIYLILYSIARIFVESIRIDSVRYVCGIPVATVMSAGIILMSLILLIINNKEITKNHKEV